VDRIGLDENEYKFNSSYNYHTHSDEPDYTEDGMTIFMNSKTLEDLMDLQNGVLSYFLQFTGYNNYEHYVDDDELNYLYRYLSDEIINKIKNLSKLFRTGIKIKEGKWGDMKAIPELFEELGLKSALDDFKYEISAEQANALEKSCVAQLKALPFDLSYYYRDGFDIELQFDYKTLIEYMKKHDIKVKTIAEFLENIYEADEFTWDNEYERIAEYIGDYKDLNNAVEKVVDKYLDSPDDIFPELIMVDNLEIFQKNKEKAFYSYIYDVHIKYNRFNVNLFQIAKKVGSKKILEWFSSKEFETFIESRDKSDIEAYQEFIFGEDVERYNL
jgi:hypothetical protein